MITVSSSGLVTLNRVEDSQFVGTHEVTFLTYRIDLDPSAIYTSPLTGLTLRVEIQIPVDDSLQDYANSFVREAPIMEEEM